MCKRLPAGPNAAEVKLNPSLNAMKTSVWKKKTVLNKYDAFFAKINYSALPFYTENLEI